MRSHRIAQCSTPICHCWGAMNFGYLGALRQRRRHPGQMHDRYRLWGTVPLRNHSAMDSALVLCPCRWSTLFGRLRYQLPRPRHFRRAKTLATAQHCTSQPPGRRRGDQVTYRTVYPPYRYAIFICMLSSVANPTRTVHWYSIYALPSPRQAQPSG